MSAPIDGFLQDVEASFETIWKRNREQMECRAGCTDCCRCRLSITHAEASLIRRALARKPHSVRTRLAARAKTGGEMCPALDENGRCEIYDARPLVCRTQGAPLRYRYPVPLIQPSRVDVCDKNFKNVDKRTLSDDDVIDQTRLDEELAEIDRTGAERVPLAHILSESS